MTSRPPQSCSSSSLGNATLCLESPLPNLSLGHFWSSGLHWTMQMDRHTPSWSCCLAYSRTAHLGMSPWLPYHPVQLNASRQDTHLSRQ